jgi:hypothetical protein
MLYVESESILTHTTTPTSPAGFDAFRRIADHGAPFTAVDGRAFMTVPAESLGGYHTLPIRSRAFRQWFFNQSLSAFDTIPTSQAFNAILHYLEARAARDSRTTNIRVPYRIDSRGLSATPEKILLDLANPEGQFVEITPDGWQVTVQEGVPFETSSSTVSLPVPEPLTHPEAASLLDTLRATLNLGAPASPDWLRCLAWLLAALRPGGPFPILILRGPSGCGKSVAARILRTLVDPASSPFTPLPSSTRELLALARCNWVLAFDHVSTLTPQIAETLCRLTSGVGVAHREQSHREPLQRFIKRPILLTVTDDWTPPPDLAARALTVTLPALTDASRRSEPEIAATIHQAFPRILGALCAAVSQALAGPPQLTSSPTRHAGALAWAQAAAPAVNCTPHQMLEAFQSPPPAGPFVDAVRGLLNGTPRWSGTAAELLKLLPLGQNPRALSYKLNQSILPLADAGIDIQFRRLPGGAKVIDLFATQNPEPPAQPPPEKELIPPPEIPPPPELCDTTPCLNTASTGQPSHSATGAVSGLVGRSPWTARDALVPLPHVVDEVTHAPKPLRAPKRDRRARNSPALRQSIPDPALSGPPHVPYNDRCP